MAAHFIVQASGAIWGIGDPDGPTGWTFVFGVFVTDEVGTPVEGLTKRDFSVWELKDPGEIPYVIEETGVNGKRKRLFFKKVAKWMRQRHSI